MKNVFFSLFLFLFAGAVFAQDTDKGYQIGDIADDFKLMNVDGQMVSLESIEGAKGYIVVFTCNHCPYAIKYEQRIIDLHNKMAELGYPVVAINPNDPEVVPEDSFEEMQVRAEEMDFPFVYLFDEGQRVYPKFGATRTPHVFLLDSERKVRYIGAIDDNTSEDPEVDETNGGRTNYVENAIMAIENGEEPEPTVTKAIGCTIKVQK